MKEDKGKFSLFTEVILSCVRLRQTVGDEFFAELLDRKLKDFISGSVSYEMINVAQYGDKIRPLDSLLELLDQLEHLKIGNTNLILPCRELLLRHKLYLIQEIKPVKKSAAVKQEEIPAPEIKNSVEIQPKLRFPERTQKAKQVRDEVLEFIRINRRVRTKDVVNQFGAISHRTILRSLKDLIGQGLITRHSESGAMIYSSVQQ